MTVDLEAGGALATAGLAAKAIDGHAEAGKAHATTCANCKAPLVGAYCHACGQVGHVHRSIGHMLEEGLHGVLHFDSKMWRTLPLLLARPGLLTRRYIDGQRVRYVAPLPLFLFTIFLMFFVLSYVGAGPKTVSQATPAQREQARVELVQEVDQAKADVERANRQIAESKDAEERVAATAELEEAQAELRAAEAVLSVFDKTTDAVNDPGKTTVVTADELKAMSRLDLDALESEVKSTGVFKHLAENPELMLYKFKNTAYKFSFMLIPISLPFLWLMFFWKRDVTTYDHMVFSMYSLSFMSIWFVVLVLLGQSSFTTRAIPYLLWLPPLHMFLQLKETYRLKFFSAFWRTIALLISSSTVFVLFIVMVGAIIAM
jgi:hypothetical protein